MSKRPSSRTKRQGSYKGLQTPKDHNDAPVGEISNTLERRRMQNRLAQRNHRKKVRDHIKALEARVISSMLQRPPPYVLPLTQSGLTQSPTITSYVPGHISQQNQRSLPDLHQTSDQTFSRSGVSRPPSTPPSDYLGSPIVEQEHYPTPATSCVSLVSLCTPVSSPVETRSSGVTFEIVPQYREPQLDSVQMHQTDPLFFQPTTEYDNYNPFANNTMDLPDIEYLSMENNISPIIPTSEASAGTDNMLAQGYHLQSRLPQSHQPPTDWIEDLNSDNLGHDQSQTMHLFQPFPNPSPTTYETPEVNLYSVPTTPSKVRETSQHYFDDTTSPHHHHHEEVSSNPTQSFQPLMAIYRTPKFGL